MYNHPEYMTCYARMAERYAKKKRIKEMASRAVWFAWGALMFVAGASAW